MPTNKKVSPLASADEPRMASELEAILKAGEGTPKLNVTAEVGTTGLKHWAGRVDEEWLTELKDERKYKVLREMRENDPIIGAILFVIDMIIRQVEWRVEQGGDSEEDEEAAEFLESCMHDMSSSWENVISEILSFLSYGFSYHEIVYKRRLGSSQKDGAKRSKFNDGKIGWRKLPIRAQDTLLNWQIDETGGVKGYVQQDPVSGKLATIPIEKALLFRTTSHKGNPEGRTILRNAFRPWFFKKRIEEIEGIGIERDLAGLPVMYAPARIMSPTATAEEQAIYSALKDIIRNIRRDEQEGIILPGDYDKTTNQKMYSLELLSTGGTRQFDTDKIITRYDQRIAMTVLADFILLGHEKVGSFALSDNKTDLFAVALQAWLNEIKSVFNRFAIPRLFEINGWVLEEHPYLEYGDIETPDLTALGDYITKLSAAGAELFPDVDLENHLREAANLPIRIEEEHGFDTPAATSTAATPGVEVKPDAQPTQPAATGDAGAVEKQVLNGAQITSMLAIIKDVIGGVLPKEVGADIIISSLGVSEPVVNRIMGKIVVNPGLLLAPEQKVPADTTQVKKRASSRKKKEATDDQSNGDDSK